MLFQNQNLKSLLEFFKLFVDLPNEKIVALIMKDFFTSSELETFAKRWQIVKMLDKEISQKEIAEKLGVGLATITHGSSALKTQGEGFKWLLKNN